MADQSMDTTKVQLSGPMSFIGITDRNMGELVTDRNRNRLKHSCITKFYLNMGDSSRILETQRTQHNLQAAQDVATQPGSSVGLSLFQAGLCFLRVAWFCFFQAV